MHKLFRKSKHPSNENFENAKQSSGGDVTRPNDTTATSPTMAETNGGSKVNRITEPPAPAQPVRPRLVFHCQQAHGSPTGIITGFTNVKELYQKIADCYDMPVEEVRVLSIDSNDAITTLHMYPFSV